MSIQKGLALRFYIGNNRTRYMYMGTWIKIVDKEV